MTAIAVKRSFEEHKEIIRDGLRSFIDVGLSLMAIRDGDLWKETHDSFQAFCQDEFDYAKSYAYQIIESAVVVRDLENSTKTDSELKKIGGKSRVLLPAHESQAHIIAKAADDSKTRLTIWTTAIKTAPDGKDGKQVTTKHLKAVADSIVHKNGKPSGGGGGSKPAKTEPPNPEFMATVTNLDAGTVTFLNQQAASNGHAPEVPPLPIPPVDPTLTREPGEDETEVFHDPNVSIVDGFKFEVPQDLRIVFAELPEFNRLRKLVSDIKSGVKNLLDSPAGGWIEQQQFQECLTQLKTLLRFSAPHTECAKCRRKIEKKCPACKGTGWVTESMMKSSFTDADNKWIEDRK